MAKKIFKYRGKTLEELQQLSDSDLLVLLPSSVRRKLSRGFTAEEKILYQKLQSKKTVKTHCRDAVILPNMVGKIVKVHKGSTFDDVEIRPEMIGHRLGEYVFTRKRVTHGSAGVGASRGTANQSKK
ncbi:MAG: 30S ribosomal protein S19 [Candidatus Woesearchaeota archaeon]